MPQAFAVPLPWDRLLRIVAVGRDEAVVELSMQSEILFIGAQPRAARRTHHVIEGTLNRAVFAEAELGDPLLAALPPSCQSSNLLLCLAQDDGPDQLLHRIRHGGMIGLGAVWSRAQQLPGPDRPRGHAPLPIPDRHNR